VTIKVRETFKGKSDRDFTIYSDSRSTVSFDFQVGREYLVFARDNDLLEVGDLPRSARIAYLCSGTAELGSADGKRRLVQVRERLQPKG
jgi:hypothetical protein